MSRSGRRLRPRDFVAVFGAEGLDQTLAIETDGAKITAFYVSRNPDKLGTVAKALGGVPIGLSK